MRERDEFSGPPPRPKPSDADDWGRLPTIKDQRAGPIGRVDLILRLSVCEADAAGGEQMLLFASLQSRSGRGPRPELLILCRDDSGTPPPWIARSAVSRQDVAWLKTLLEASGFPERTPRLAPIPGRGPSRGRRWIELEVRMDDRPCSLTLCLEPAGFSGPDAWVIAAVLERIGELAEAAGRPSVCALLYDLTAGRSRVADWELSPAPMPSGGARATAAPSGD
jgi:hypothetical protein